MMEYCDELCFKRKLQAKEIGNTTMHLFISRFESTPEKCSDVDKMPYTIFFCSQSHSQWTNMFVTKTHYKSH